jgi:hypothetical protein
MMITLRNWVPFLVMVTCLLALPAIAHADFGLVSGSVGAVAKNKDGTVTSQAGSHPYSYDVDFKLNTDAEGLTEGGEMRDVIVDLPPGFVGNPEAVPQCPRRLFEGFLPACPPNTQIGVLRVLASTGLGQVLGPLFNLVPPPGVAGQIGFSIASNNALENASVRSSEGYGLEIATSAPTEIRAATEEIWGVPADPGHDAERGLEALEHDGPPLSSDAPLQPYLTMPASCQVPPEIEIKVDSKLAPGVFDEQSAPSLDGGGNPVPLGGCDAVPFAPKVSSQPTSRQSSSPSGLDFELNLPNQGWLSPGGIAETEPKKTVFTLPEGMTVNPSLVEGIGVCSPAQYKAEQVNTPAGAGCPESSKLGSVIASSPLIKEQIKGAVYLAAPYENPFGTLTALYLVARAPERGVIVKQAGKVELDPSTGQIETTFDNLPPLPYSSFELNFREGARAPLATPPACGEYKSTATFIPFSAKDDSEAVNTTASFQVERGPDGGACPSGGLPSFRPGLIAGTLNNAAGRFSPFNVRLFRTDSEQEINRFSIKLPPGIVGKLAGIPFCSDAQIAAAKARTGIQGGQEEIEHPSCPTASQIGRSLAGAGVGSALAYAPGRIYLAGPYHGSAISLVAITAAKVGPFDLGTVVIRQAFKVDPETGEVFIDATGSDPIPHIIQGVPTHLRDIRAYTDRPQFVLNPTSCKRTSTASTLLGSGIDFASEADDRPVTVSTPFQAADCAALPFKPRLALKLKGGTRRGDFPALTARLRMNGFGEAGIRRSQVTLPPSEFIANAHFNTICTRVIFKQGAHPGERCPAGAVYGKAIVNTPILSEPLTGPVFLRSSEHELPDVVAAVHNGEIDVTLVGRVDSVKGKLRTTFEATPDAPVGSVILSLRGGKKGLFENSTNLCQGTHKALAAFTGHNGKLREFSPKLQPRCGGKGRKAHKHKRRGVGQSQTRDAPE